LLLGVKLIVGEEDRKVEHFFVKNKQLSSRPPGRKNPENPKEKPAAVESTSERPVEIGGPKGPEPTRYGDWEKAGRCSDF